MNNTDRHIIKVPPINEEARIGSVFNNILNVMFKTEQEAVKTNNKIIWDFSDCSFIHPFFAGILSVLNNQYNGLVELSGIGANLQLYLDEIYFESPMRIQPEKNDSKTWDRYKGKSHLPICVFSPMDLSSVKVQELIQDGIHRNMGLDNRLKNIVSLILAELIDNITEHSHSKEGFIFCQNLPSQDTLYIMINDTGRSIYSSYASDIRYTYKLTNMESSGMLLALKGMSTKDRPENENRGYGISKSRRMIVEGLGGEFFILSGTSFARHDINGETVADLPGDIRWNGTAIMIKMPTHVPGSFNLYNYIS